jgi:hypothetical protein
MRPIAPWIVVAGLLCPAAAEAHPFVVNEVVSDPQQDWNDVAGPFDATPGSGSASTADEWIEIKNVSPGAASLAGFTLRMQDGTDVDDCFGFSAIPPCTAAGIYRVFTSAGVELTGGTLASRLTAVPAGGYVVVGDPSGSINNAITITLLDPLHAAVDVALVEANASSLLDEAAARFSDGADSGSAGDFSSLAATLGESNGALCALAPGDAVVNEAVGDPQRDWDHDGGPGAFDGTPGAGLVNERDEYVEIKNTAAGARNLSGCVLSMTDTSPESLVLQLGDPRVHVFDAAGAPAGGLAAVPAGGYVLVGDPPGAMNQSVTIALRGEALLDQLDFGGDAPGLGAGSADDEASSRVPDGWDTGAGATDCRRQRATPGASNELDECALGVASCPATASCEDTPAGYACTCAPGFTSDGMTCVDIDECLSGDHDCGAHALCTNGEGSYECACADGFSGDGHNCSDIDECAGAPCDLHAICDNQEGSFTCACDAGWHGDGRVCTRDDECGDDCDPVMPPESMGGSDSFAPEPPAPPEARCAFSPVAGDGSWLLVLCALALVTRGGAALRARPCTTRPSSARARRATPRPRQGRRGRGATCAPRRGSTRRRGVRSGQRAS